MIAGIILGILLAAGLAFMITMRLVCKSNVLGDTKGTFYTFSKGSLNMMQSKDNIKWSIFD